MGKMDTDLVTGEACDDDMLFVQYVAAHDADLLYLDAYLTELFGQRG